MGVNRPLKGIKKSFERIALKIRCRIHIKPRKQVLLLEPMYAYKEKNILIRYSANFYSGSPINIREPIAAEYIGSYLESKGISVDIIQQTTIRDEDILSLIVKIRPRILGISIHSTHIFPRILTFLRKCKEKNQKMVIVCGGNHPTCVPEIVAEDCIDYVVRGEGEETFYELVKAILDNEVGLIENIKGISFKENNTVIHNPPRERFNFSKSPWPIRKRDILKNIKCGPLCYPSPTKQKCAAQISYSRGCPFNCEFCVSPIVFPGKVIYRHADDVVNEIEYLQKEFGTNFLFFNDLTFNASPRKVVELCDELLTRDIKIHWFAYCSIHIKDPIIKKMAAAGCTRIGSGAESFLDRILSIYKSQQNLQMIRKALNIIDKYGILNRVYIMIGYPEETKEMLEKTLEIMKKLPIDQPRLAFITPFPGTPFYKKFENKLTTKMSEKFTGDYPVIRNEEITPEEYLNIRNNIVRNFYNSDQYMEHVEDKCNRFPHLIESFKYFIEYLKDKKIFKKSRYLTFIELLSNFERA